MRDLVTIKNGKPTVSTKEISDIFNKPHRNIMRDIENLKCSDNFRALNFERSTYTSPQNKTFDCYDMTKDGFAFLCMGFTGRKAAEWKEAYICAFNKMERYIKNEIVDNSLMGAINDISVYLDNLAKAGSAWGRAGNEIKNKKKEATDELLILINKSQMQLGI